VKRDL